MDILLPILKSAFFWGLLVGLGLAGMALWTHWKTKREFARYKKMLSDKMEIEADNYAKLKEEKERLAQENENLRIKVGSTGNNPVRELERELEIFARAEKSMVINAPGFGGAWESAKSAAHEELLAEDRGKSIPKRIFRKFFRADGTLAEATAEPASLPENAGAGKETASEEAAQKSA